jgi:hypothetical protein
MHRSIQLACVIILGAVASVRGAASDYFAIEVVDEQTGRGVPLVELKTVNNIRYYTDSNGLVAFDEQGLMGHKVFFTITSHGYEFAKDGFGYPGVALDVKAGGSTKLKIKRINIAERVYRITGEGIYRDTVRLGRDAPIEEPLLNAEVLGQDSVYAEIYRGQIHWFWGDTSRAAYPLGQFNTSGAVSDLPEKGGLKPGVGVNLKYFAEKGFSRPMAPMKEKGPVWIEGVVVLNDGSPERQGHERMLCHFSRMKDLGTRLERGLMVYNDEKNIFEKSVSVPLDAVLAPSGHATRVKLDGQEYFYFSGPYPAVRVKADWKSVRDLNQYEAYTCLAQGTRYKKGDAKLDRAEGGKLNWSWKKNTQPVQAGEIEELVSAGKMKREESPFQLVDVDTKKPIRLHGSSVYWNDYRNKYVMIALQGMGTSVLGEVFLAESEKMEGPWTSAKKIVTHNKMDFYNPTQHPFFDEEGGKIIYFEGTYTNTFSGDPTPTPWYEYNQVMYRLDLGDPRLKMTGS